MNISKCKLINLPKIINKKGNLSFIESNKHLPFSIKRVYYLYDVPGGETRGGHAHKQLKQFLIAMNGSFDVLVDDGLQKKKFHLNRAYYGLYIPPMIWRELDNFSSGAVCLSLVSAYYNEKDYIRNYRTFNKALKKRIK